MGGKLKGEQKTTFIMGVIDGHRMTYRSRSISVIRTTEEFSTDKSKPETCISMYRSDVTMA
jgi:hypothetical protein